MTSFYSKTSTSLRSNLILQRFCEMIWDIIFSRTVCGYFLFFCRSRFINNFVANSIFFGTVKSPKVKYLETHLLQKSFRTLFWRLICTNKLEGFLQFRNLKLLLESNFANFGNWQFTNKLSRNQVLQNLTAAKNWFP